MTLQSTKASSTFAFFSMKYDLKHDTSAGNKILVELINM